MKTRSSQAIIRQENHPKSSPLSIDALPFKSAADNSEGESADRLRVAGKWFTDQDGRVCMLRGVNLSGSCKNPARPYQPSHGPHGFHAQHREVSFVGRPFPLAEADEHFMRLRSWGFTFLRFQITWEAIEHRGPGQMDDEYLDYVVAVLRKAKRNGFRCFVDPHQDVVSLIHKFISEKKINKNHSGPDSPGGRERPAGRWSWLGSIWRNWWSRRRRWCTTCTQIRSTFRA